MISFLTSLKNFALVLWEAIPHRKKNFSTVARNLNLDIWKKLSWLPYIWEWDKSFKYNLSGTFSSEDYNSCASYATGISVVVTNIFDVKDEFEDYKTFRSTRFRTQQNSQQHFHLVKQSNDLNSEVDVLEYWSSCSMRYPVQ